MIAVARGEAELSAERRNLTKHTFGHRQGILCLFVQRQDLTRVRDSHEVALICLNF